MKKISWFLIGVAVIALVYYFFLVPYEYRVRFKAATNPGDVIQTVRLWERSLDSSMITNVDTTASLVQTISWEKRNYRFTWMFEMINDSVTSVVIEMSEPGERFMNKLLVPLSERQIEIDANEIGRQFYDVLKTHLQITRVTVIGETRLDPNFCVCRSATTKQTGKAFGMMKDYSPLSSFVDDFELKPDGLPIVRVTEWDHDKNHLAFDFCFPILKMDSLPDSEFVRYKAFPGQTVLHAEYRGNYITSDRAWYDLFRYAENNGYEVVGFPIEYFHDNPNTGVNEEEWLADIYLPVKKRL